jgi:hypothetical protein
LSLELLKVRLSDRQEAGVVVAGCEGPGAKVFMDHKQYLEDVQCSTQWRAFLAALAAELAADAGEDELCVLMRRLGARMVAGWPAFACDNLDDLQREVNAIWRDMNWGWVEIHDLGDHIELSHFASPLRAAFGDAAMSWVPALLEGAYNDLFGRLGADATLVLRQLPAAADDGGDLQFYFGAEPV